MKKYGYFGEGLEGYMHYMQSFEDNSTSGSSNINDSSYATYQEKYHTDTEDIFSDDDNDLFLSDDEEEEDYWEEDEEEEDNWEDDEEDEELPTMTIDGHITLGFDESEIDFLLKFEDFLEENGWSFDGLTMDD